MFIQCAPDCGLATAGGAFEWVSCPHYLAEVVIYVGLLFVLRGRHVNAWLILFWVVRPCALAAVAICACAFCLTRSCVKCAPYV